MGVRFLLSTMLVPGIKLGSSSWAVSVFTRVTLKALGYNVEAKSLLLCPIDYFSHCNNKIPDEINLRKEEIVFCFLFFFHNLRLQSVRWGSGSSWILR